MAEKWQMKSGGPRDAKTLGLYTCAFLCKCAEWEVCVCVCLCMCMETERRSYRSILEVGLVTYTFLKSIPAPWLGLLSSGTLQVSDWLLALSLMWLCLSFSINPKLILICAVGCAVVRPAWASVLTPGDSIPLGESNIYCDPPSWGSLLENHLLLFVKRTR